MVNLVKSLTIYYVGAGRVRRLQGRKLVGVWDKNSESSEIAPDMGIMGAKNAQRK